MNLTIISLKFISWRFFESFYLPSWFIYHYRQTIDDSSWTRKRISLPQEESGPVFKK